jgi:hypothetical protein
MTDQSDNTPDTPDASGDLSPEQVGELIVALRDVRTEVADLKKAAEDEAKERKTENEKRDNRIKWSQRAITAAVVAAVMGVLAGVSGLIYGLSAKATADELQAGRTASRADTCSMGEALANGLISASPAPTSEAKRVDAQMRIDVFERNLEGATRTIGCDFHLLPAPPVKPVGG